MYNAPLRETNKKKQVINCFVPNTIEGNFIFTVNMKQVIITPGANGFETVTDVCTVRNNDWCVCKVSTLHVLNFKITIHHEPNFQ